MKAYLDQVLWMCLWEISLYIKFVEIRRLFFLLEVIAPFYSVDLVIMSYIIMTKIHHCLLPDSGYSMLNP